MRAKGKRAASSPTLTQKRVAWTEHAVQWSPPVGLDWSWLASIGTWYPNGGGVDDVD